MASPFNDPFRLPQSPFEMPPYGTPGIGDGLTPPEEAFTWGAGGARMTPDDLAAKRELAQALMKSNYSPVGSIWEGLGRVTDNISGALETRGLDKEARAQASDKQALYQALFPEGGAVAAAMASGDKGLNGVGEMLWKQAHPAAPQPTEWERLLVQSGVQPGTPEWVQANVTKRDNTLDPWTNIVSGGESFTGRQSLVQQALQGGGGPSVSASGASAPPQAAIGYLMQNPATAAQFEQKYGAGSAAKYLGGGGGNVTSPFP